MSSTTLRESYPIVVPVFLLVWMTLGWLLKKVVFVWVRHLARKTTTNLDDILVSAAELPAFILIAAAGVGLAYLLLLPEPIAKNLAVFLPAFLKIAVIFSVVLFADGAIGGWVSDYSSQHEFLRVAHGLING